MKKGILVVSFGTTYRDTREKNIEALEKMIRETHGEISFYRAFSSGIVRRKMMQMEGITVMNAHEALTQMKQDGITHVYILPTYVINGFECNRLKKEAGDWKDTFVKVQIASPLLTEEKDYEKVVEALWQEYMAKEESKALVLIGHGTDHESHASYERLEKTFGRLGHPNVYVATVEGAEDMAALIDRMGRERTGPRDVILAPLMLTAGDHANHDMAGDGDSYLSRLTKAGYRVQAVIRGLGECGEIRAIYGSHLNQIL